MNHAEETPSTDEQAVVADDSLVDEAVGAAVEEADGEEVSAWLQFPVSSLFLLTAAVAIGFAGHRVLHPKLFAGMLAIVANIVVFGCEYHEIDDPRAKLCSVLVCAACAAAIVVALTY